MKHDSYRSSAVLPLASENVLVCLRYGIGDVVMELPALTALRAALPHARITAVGSAPAHELLEGDPRVDALVTTDRWGLRHRWDPGDEQSRAAVASWIRAEGFDLVLDAAQATLAVAEAIWALGYRSLEADRGAERRALEAGASGVEAIRVGVRAGWGLDVPADCWPELGSRPEDDAAAAELLRRHGIAGARPFAVSPVASMPLKRWPHERFATVADQILERGTGRVLILEGPQAEAGRAVIGAMRHADAAIRIGPLHLLTTAALLRRCAVLVCNDTGIMHIGGAVGTPTIGVFGPTRAQYFLPPVAGAAAVEPAELECGYRDTRSLFPPECWRNGACLIAEHGCIHRTRTEDVVAAVSRVLSPAQPRRRVAHDRRAREGAAVGAG